MSLPAHRAFLLVRGMIEDHAAGEAPGARHDESTPANVVSLHDPNRADRIREIAALCGGGVG